MGKDLCDVSIGGISMMIDIKNGEININDYKNKYKEDNEIESNVEDKESDDSEKTEASEENEETDRIEDWDLLEDDESSGTNADKTNGDDKGLDENSNEITDEDEDALFENLDDEVKSFSPKEAKEYRDIIEDSYRDRMMDYADDNKSSLMTREDRNRYSDKIMGIANAAYREKSIESEDNMVDTMKDKITVLEKKHSQGKISDEDYENIRWQIGDLLSSIKEKKDIRKKQDNDLKLAEEVWEEKKRQQSEGKRNINVEDILKSLEEDRKIEKKTDEIKEEGKGEKRKGSEGSENWENFKEVEQKCKNLDEEKSGFSSEVNLSKNQVVQERKNEGTKNIPERKSQQNQNKLNQSSNYKEEKRKVQAKEKFDYSKLESKELSRVVKEKMIELGVKNHLINQQTMIDEFGVPVLKQLMRNGTVVNKNNMYTIGI